MINEETKRAILKALGKSPIQKISDYAFATDFLKKDGTPYSASMFSHVLNGRRDYPKIEEVILAAANDHLKLNEERQRRQDELVRKVKHAD